MAGIGVSSRRSRAPGAEPVSVPFRCSRATCSSTWPAAQLRIISTGSKVLISSRIFPRSATWQWAVEWWMETKQVGMKNGPHTDGGTSSTPNPTRRSELEQGGAMNYWLDGLHGTDLSISRTNRAITREPAVGFDKALLIPYSLCTCVVSCLF
jgi:hypothetical protein